MPDLAVPHPSSPSPSPSPSAPTTPPPPLFHPSSLHLITQGAEALLYRTTYLTPHHPVALKHRPPKPYRHPILDARLTKQRLLAEARTLVKLKREGVLVPGLLGADWGGVGADSCARGGWIVMEWVAGWTVRRCLDVWKTRGEGEEVRGLMGRVGRAVGRLHGVGVVHGDLTTSNLMVRPEGTVEGVEEREGHHTQRPRGLPIRFRGAPTTTVGVRRQLDTQDGGGSRAEERGMPDPDPDPESLEGEIVLIDFGLSTQTVQDEDRAVDLYVLERAFGSTHPQAEGLFQEVLRCYGESYKGAKVVLRRLEDVRLRGRKKSMIG